MNIRICRKADESDDAWSRRGPYYAVLKRIEAHKDFFERVFKLQPRCMAVFGESADKIFLLMHQSRRNIEVSAQMLCWQDGLPSELKEQMRRDVTDRKEFEAEKDEVGRKLREFRAQAHSLCQPIIDQEYREKESLRFRYAEMLSKLLNKVFRSK